MLGGRRGPSLNDGAPFYIGHRGNALRAPEDTLEAYRAALQHGGGRLLEQDLYETSDGALAVIHNATVDYVSTSTGNVSDLTEAQWLALSYDADAWLGGGIPGSPTTFARVVRELKGKTILTPEVRSLSAAQTAVSILRQHRVRPDQVLAQSSSVAYLAPFQAAGYPACIISFSGTAPLASAQAAGITWACISETESDATISAWVSAGFKTICYTVSRRWRRDQLLALGVIGFFSDDAAYMGSDQPERTRDDFASGNWSAGMLAASDSLAASYRGRFSTGGYWGFSDAPSLQSFVLQGWACPVGANVANDNYSVTFKIRFDAVLGGDQTRWASIVMNDASVTDTAYTGTPTSTDKNYNCIIRKNGSIVIFLSAGTNVTTLASAASAAIADGEEVTMKLTVSPSAIRLARLDGTGAEIAAAAANDTTYRGGYFFLGRHSAAVQFRDVSITS